MSEKKYVYVVVRTDLSLPQQLVQAAHAAHEAGLLAEPSAEPSSLIALQVPNKSSLEKALSKLNEHVRCVPFYEPDNNEGLTAFASEPIPPEQRKIFSKYQLWKGAQQ